MPPIRFALAATVTAVLLAGGARAQTPADVRGEVFVGSEAEQYLRVLQVAGDAPWYPWSVRGFGPGEIDRMAPADSAAHPWKARYRLERDTARGTRFRLVRPDARVILNSGFPFGGNDGAVWAGRGATVAVQGGFSMRAGPVSLTLAPVAFVAQNAGFDLVENGYEGPQAYADPRYPYNIDLPQRFGDGAYARIDPGESTVRLDLGPVALGASTASQAWGPAADLPLLLGNNAGGFPHAFAGTGRPVNVGLGRLHARIVWGRLHHSAYAPDSVESSRFMAGLAAVLTPRGVPGLEVGAARFFHSPAGSASFTKPLEGFFKSGLAGGSGGDGSDADNQLASLFFRWAFPRSGFEAYGEYGREDHSFDAHDALLEPDHNGGYMLGVRRVWRPAPGQRVSLRAEVMDTRPSHLSAVRNQTNWYVHGGMRQGHTLGGQALGAPSGYGGGGAVVALDRYTGGGRLSARYTRARGPASQPTYPDPEPDVTHALGLERLWFRGRMEVSAGLTGAYQVNRHHAGDAFNANAVLRFRTGL
jgi:hypothetical protein